MTWPPYALPYDDEPDDRMRGAGGDTTPVPYTGPSFPVGGVPITEQVVDIASADSATTRPYYGSGYYAGASPLAQPDSYFSEPLLY